MTSRKFKHTFLLMMAFMSLSALFVSCGSDSSGDEIVLPTEGLITVVEEVEKDLFKIADEVTIPSTEESLIIANYLDNTSDTFTLAEAKLYEANPGSNPRTRSVVRAASYGFFGYMMGRSMARRPSAGAYTSKAAHQKVSNTAGSSLQKTAKRTPKPKPKSKSGFGKGKSTRSYGG